MREDGAFARDPRNSRSGHAATDPRRSSGPDLKAFDAMKKQEPAGPKTHYVCQMYVREKKLSVNA